MTDVLAAGAAAFLVGIALGWALARSSGAAVALREDNARLRAELAHLQQAVPAQLAVLDHAQAQLKASFDSLAGAALR